MVIKNRNLFRLTRFILLKIPRLFNLFAKTRSSNKRLLIIKLDAIGDYILFRNFIEITKQSKKFAGYQIDLLGNLLWKDVALAYDAAFINEFYFIESKELYETPLKTLRLGWLLFKNNYEVVLQPSYTRVLLTDGLANLTSAKEIIGFAGDNESISKRYKTKTDQIYSLKLALPKKVYFEFDRNKFFFENVLNSSIGINAPDINLIKTKKNGIVILPGAGVPKRRWPTDKFLILIRRILEYSTQKIYLVGEPSEITIGDFLIENLPAERVVNLIGKTSLLQLIEIIGNSNLVIANETSAIHIAAATKIKSICLVGGGHFERFAPYPDHLENRPLCVYKKMECYDCCWHCRFDLTDGEHFPCVSNISVNAVWEIILELFDNELEQIMIIN